jgi:1-carboxybiuret hydrolase subunit AtzG-like protein
MAGSPLDDYIAAAARALDLPIEASWMPAVKTNLEVTLRLATVVADFELPDTTEPAPIYKV